MVMLGGCEVNMTATRLSPVAASGIFLLYYNATRRNRLSCREFHGFQPIFEAPAPQQRSKTPFFMVFKVLISC